MKSMFVEQIWLLADALNAGIDEVTVDIEAIPAEQDHQIFDRLLRAGTTAGQRWNMVGRRDGEPRVEIETLWTVGNEYPEHWPAPEHGWTLTIEGDPSMRVHFLTLASFTRKRASPNTPRRATSPPECRCSTPCPRCAKRPRVSPPMPRCR